MDRTKITRRGFLITSGIAAGLTTAVNTTAQTLGFEIEYTFSILDGDIHTPNEYTYDAYEWNGTGALQFESDTGLTETAVFGDTNYPPEDTDIDIISVEGGITLPMNIQLIGMQPSTAFFLVGLMATLLGGSLVLKNPAAGAMWGLAFILLIVAGVFGMGLQLFWLAVILIISLLIVGMVARWA